MRILADLISVDHFNLGDPLDIDWFNSVANIVNPMLDSTQFVFANGKVGLLVGGVQGDAATRRFILAFGREKVNPRKLKQPDVIKKTTGKGKNKKTVKVKPDAWKTQGYDDTAEITFPDNVKFSRNPIVMITAQGAEPVVVNLISITESGFTFGIKEVGNRKGNIGIARVHWVAFGMSQRSL